LTSQPFFVPAVIIALLAIPLILGLIPRNWGYGVRTPKTLSDDRIWYSANRFGGWAFVGSAIAYLVIAALFPCAPGAGTDLSGWSLHLAAFIGPLLLSILLIGRYARTL
jgi:hypothetical protein